MPLSTNLNVSPYFADYNANSDYYQILFKPGVSVQVRELNNLQLWMQNQIEMFGENIFSSGTIVAGCNFQFLNPYPYICINDADVYNNPTYPTNYIGYSILNKTTGLQATVLNAANGYQTTPPNLKTLYIKYVNTGNTGSNLTQFSAGDTLTLFNAVTNPVNQVNIESGGIGFSNSNLLISVPALVVQQTSGGSGPSIGDYLNNGNGYTNVQIVSVTAGNTANQYIVGIAPRPVDLANSQANSLYWTFNIYDTLTNTSNTIALTVNQIIGSGLQGNIVTDSVGTITSVSLFSGGTGYTTVPYVTVQSYGNLSGYNTLNLQAQNFLTQVIVASAANSVGNGYAFGVTGGIIFQKGMLLEVNPQVILIDKYDTQPDNVSVGFITNETIVSYLQDQSLLDNANGQLNFQAPGADRMMLTPTLLTLNANSVNGNNQFLSLVSWKAGQPYQQQQQTIYSTIGAEMAQRTLDADGDFVIDPFVVTSVSSSNAQYSAEYVNMLIDPGAAYINGYKVQTYANYNEDDLAGINTTVVNNHAISMNYENYFQVANLAGSWLFNTGGQVNFYTAAGGYRANGNFTPSSNGVLIGNAYMRSLVLDQANPLPGTGNTIYDLYLFNVQLANGYSTANIASIAVPGNAGICDTVQVPNPAGSGPTSLNANGVWVNTIPSIIGANQSTMCFWSGVSSLKNANNVLYNYRTSNSAIVVSNTGVITIPVPSNLETFPYSGTLTQTQLRDFIVIPNSQTLVYENAISGNSIANTSTNTIVAALGTTYLSDLSTGDWITVINIANTAQTYMTQVTGIVNNAYMTVSNVANFTANANVYRTFPAGLPIPFGFDTSLTGNVNPAETTATLTFPSSFAGDTSPTATVAYNVARSNNPTQTTKTANRNQYVLIYTATNAGGSTGPWCLGVPDAFRLRGVYIGNSSVNTSSTNYISSFYINPNQYPDYLGLSYLNTVTGAGIPSLANQYMLVCFDYFTTTGTPSYTDTVSYLQTANATQVFLQDSLPLANLTTFCNSLEVPEFFDNNGNDYDMLQYIDFRPIAANTTSPGTTPGGAPLNPSATLTFGSTEHKFPVPGSNFTATIEGYQGRIDSLYVDQNGNFTIGTGAYGANISLLSPPQVPIGMLDIADVAIPPYPTLPINISSQVQQILNTGVIFNQKYTSQRVPDHTVYNLAANSSIVVNQPPVYTMSDIARIDAQVQQLQYYVTLNTLESNAAALTIPSSVNPAENRTTYGIFTDDFTTSSFSALSDPEYQAMKLPDGNIGPTAMQWDETCYGAYATPTPAYIQAELFQQGISTVTPTIIPQATDPYGQPTCALNLSNTVAYTTYFRNASDLPVGQTSDVVNLTFASQATVYENITVQSQTINQFLINNQYNPYTSLVQQIDNLLNAAAARGTENPLDINILYIQNFSSYSYDPGTQTLTVYGQNLVSEGQPLAYYGGAIAPTYLQQEEVNQVTIPNISSNIANLLGQLLTKQISIAQFAAALTTTTSGSLPTGGTYVAEQYYPPVSFYFYNYDNSVRYQIYQNGVLIADTANGAQDLDAADIALLTGPAAQYWFADQASTFMQPYVQSGAGVQYAGKLTFNYNPANGDNFQIVTTELASGGTNPVFGVGAIYIRWRWVIAYPINGSSVGCVPSVINENVTATETVTAQTSTYTFTSQCGNGQGFGGGQISVLTGFTATWSNPSISTTPTTSVVPFDTTQDWGLVS